MKEEYFLGKNEIESDLLDSGWKLMNDSLQKEYVFKTFIEVIDFLNILWGFFEEVHHHPDFTVRYNRITFFLRSHEEKRITEKDFIVAQLIENVHLCLANR
jgi:4a-hydroxytetrahydrobiopterin dehydratase